MAALRTWRFASGMGALGVSLGVSAAKTGPIPPRIPPDDRRLGQIPVVQSGRQTKKNAAKSLIYLAASVLVAMHRMMLDDRLVELGGIEPPSESHCRADLHA